MLRQRQTIDDLYQIGEFAVELLIKALATSNQQVHRGVSLALGSIGDRRAVEPLIKELENKKWKDPYWITTALGLLGDERAVEPLLHLTRQKGLMNSQAKHALGHIGDFRSLKPLVKEWEKINFSRHSSTGQAIKMIILKEESVMNTLISSVEMELSRLDAVALVRFFSLFSYLSFHHYRTDSLEKLLEIIISKMSIDELLASIIKHDCSEKARSEAKWLVKLIENGRKI